MSELPIAAVDRLIRRVGVERVSESAAEELAEVLEERGVEIAEEALELSEHSGRKTVRAEDIRLATKTG